jgi:hypothetical protein
MSLREDIWEHLPETVTDVKVERSDIHGLDAIQVTVYYRSSENKPMYLKMNFAKKNQMNGNHISSVIKSYLPSDLGTEVPDE